MNAFWKKLKTAKKKEPAGQKEKTRKVKSFLKSGIKKKGKTANKANSKVKKSTPSLFKKKSVKKGSENNGVVVEAKSRRASAERWSS